MEERYWELRKEMVKAYDKWFATSKISDYEEYENAREIFYDFCDDTLRKLIEKMPKCWKCWKI